MPVKIEDLSTAGAPRSTTAIINSALDVIPREHQRGLQRLVIVDRIQPDTRINLPGVSELPALYHPRMGAAQPWCEIALGVLLPKKGLFKKLAARLNYRANLVGLVLSLQAQHFHLTLSHGIKKHQYENAIRSYVEKYHEIWRERQGGLRMRLFRPLRPYLDRWARSLRKKYQAAQKAR
ncbi:MAG: hypothetical protein KF868_12330 [Acidobacteria bacterium]|nr:hypothetical protein [Acidobacteriota bacterium]